MALLKPPFVQVWYVSLQAILGLIQFVIALAMLAGYRRVGVWGEF